MGCYFTPVAIGVQDPLHQLNSQGRDCIRALRLCQHRPGRHNHSCTRGQLLGCQVTYVAVRGRRRVQGLVSGISPVWFRYSQYVSATILTLILILLVSEANLLQLVFWTTSSRGSATKRCTLPPAVSASAPDTAAAVLRKKARCSLYNMVCFLA